MLSSRTPGGDAKLPANACGMPRKLGSAELAAVLHSPLHTDELQQDGLAAYVFLLLLPQLLDYHIVALPMKPVAHMKQLRMGS